MVGLLPRRYGLCGQTPCDVVAVGRSRGAVLSRDVERHGHWSRRGKVDDEAKGGRSGIAFVCRDIIS